MRASAGGNFVLDIVYDVEWSIINRYIKGIEENVFVADVCREEIKSDTKIEDIKPYFTINDNENTMSNYDLKDILANVENYESIGQDHDGLDTVSDLTYKDKDFLKKFQNVDIPSSSFNKIKYYSNKSSENILLLTGEQGFNNRVKKFAFENYATQIYIPIENRIKCLNSSIATAILLYEIRRQYSIENNDIKS